MKILLVSLTWILVNMTQYTHSIAAQDVVINKRRCSYLNDMGHLMSLKLTTHVCRGCKKESVMKRMKWWGYPNCQPCPLQRRLFTNRSNQNVIYCFMLGWLLTHSLAASVKEYTCASFCDSVQHQNLCVASCWPPHSRSTLKNIPSPRLWLIWHIAYTPIILCYSTWCCCVLWSKHEYLVRSFFVTNGFPTTVDPYKKRHLVRRNQCNSRSSLKGCFVRQHHIYISSQQNSFIWPRPFLARDADRPIMNYANLVGCSFPKYNACPFCRWDKWKSKGPMCMYGNVDLKLPL